MERENIQKYQDLVREIFVESEDESYTSGYRSFTHSSQEVGRKFLKETGVSMKVKLMQE